MVAAAGGAAAAACTKLEGIGNDLASGAFGIAAKKKKKTMLSADSIHTEHLHHKCRYYQNLKSFR